MFSFASKRITAFLFTALVVAPMFFMVPFTPGKGPNVADAACTYLIIDCLGTVTIGVLMAPVNALLYVFFITIPQFFFGLAGSVFDVFLAFSLSSTVIKNPDFVNQGWVIMRDLSNTFFIFILLYIAISTILQLAGGGTKRLLATLVVVALFMNFSLYITKFVIDVGNVFALEFYTNVGVDNGLSYITLGTVTNGIPSDIQPRSVSSAFMGVFDLEKLSGLTLVDSLAQPGKTAFFIILLGIMYLVATFVFLSAGFLFLARVVAFWFLMILAPLAFFSTILPFTRGKIWGRWFPELISQTFFAPIFLFFIYIAMILVHNKTINSLFVANNNGQSDITKFLLTFLTFFTLIAVLLAGLKTAKSMSGTLGASMLSIGQKVTGTAVGAGLGATAFLGRKYIGGYGRDFLQKTDAEGRTREERMRASTTGRMLLGATGDLGSKASFDVRGLGADKLAKMGGVDIGTAQKGGYNAQLAEKVKAKEAEYNSIRDPKLKAQYLGSMSDKDVSFALYSKASAKDRMEMSAKSPQHQAMFQSFAQRMGGKEQSENHKEAVANAKDVRDPRTGVVTKTKDVVRAEYLHNMENIGMRPNMSSQDRNAQLVKNLNAQREAIESMSADDVSDMLTSAKNNTAVTAPDQVKMIQEAIGRTGHEKQVGINQAILRDVKEKIDPITGAVTTSSADQRADLIGAIPNPEVQKSLWAKETSEMRAEILSAPSTLANPALKKKLEDLENTLSPDQRERDRNANILVRERKGTAKQKKNISDALIAAVDPVVVATPGGVASEHAKIDVAVKNLSSQQFAALEPDILIRPEMEKHLNRTRLHSIAERKELEPTQIHDLILKHLNQEIPAGATLTGDALEEMKKLYKDDKLKMYLNQAERDRIKAAI